MGGNLGSKLIPVNLIAKKSLSPCNLMYSIDSGVLHLHPPLVAGVHGDKTLELGIGDSVDRLDVLSVQVRLKLSGWAQVMLYQEPGYLRHFCRERMKRNSEYFDAISCPLIPDEISEAAPQFLYMVLHSYIIARWCAIRS
jgi:hypothetical protein